MGITIRNRFYNKIKEWIHLDFKCRRCGTYVSTKEVDTFPDPAD